LNPIFILASTAIHPQPQDFPRALSPLIQEGLRCCEPDYSQLIPAGQLRRMSRVLRMGVYAGMDCLRKAGISRPDGIITGTGKGSMSDTEKFVRELNTYQEEALNPTPFILSTYNAINGALALQTQATGYNQTYVHRGCSFEWSLYDAQLKLQDADTSHMLVGSFEELTSEYFLIKNKIGYWKKTVAEQVALWQQANTSGTIAGEGSAFFVLSDQPQTATMCIHAVRTASQPEQITQFIQQALKDQQWEWEDIDLLVLGNNGAQEDELPYNELFEKAAANIPIIAFKHLCGEYETSGSFALWLMHQWSLGQPIPDPVWIRKPEATSVCKKILVYNHYRNTNHNVLLLENISPSGQYHKIN